MNMYQQEDAPFFDYQIQQVGSLFIRGPVPDFDGAFFVCVGAAQTFGRYVHNPYPHQVEKVHGLPSLNLSSGGAGPSFFQTEDRLSLINRSRFAVIQVLSGRAESNTIFESDGKATLKVRIDGLRFADAHMQDIAHALPLNARIPKRDDLSIPKGLQMHSTLAYEILVQNRDDVVCEMAINESKLRYAASMTYFLRQIRVPKILLYFSERAPAYQKPMEPGRRKYKTAFDVEGIYPQFVDDEVMQFIAPHADAVTYCVSSRGKPHLLPEGMLVSTPEGVMAPIKVNEYYPSPEMHDDASVAVLKAVKQLGLACS